MVVGGVKEEPPRLVTILLADGARAWSCQSQYRHLHIDYRTTRHKFSPQMERKVKMPLKPGRGLMDWIRVCQENPNMGTSDGKPIRVTEKDMEEHSQQDNAWMIINGKVYNVAPYMEYHPGGIEQLMRAAGTDGTKLFNEKHPWVNYESMLKSCFVGHFVGSASKLRSPGVDPLLQKKTTLGAPMMSTLAPPPAFCPPSSKIEYPGSLIELGVRALWKEDGDNVQLLLDTPWTNMGIEQVVVECMDRHKLRVVFRTTEAPPEVIWTLPVQMNPLSLKVAISALTPGRLSISFQKQDPAIVWPEFVHDCVVGTSEGRKYRICHIRSIETITHDTRLFTVDLPDGDALPVPVGSHVFLRLFKEGRDVERPYTPVISSVLSPPNGVPSTTVHLLIKVYSQGYFTPALWDLKKGSTLEMSDPQGSFNLNQFLNCDHIVLLAAGTGFTPMARIIHHCLQKLDKRITLLFFNKTEKDIFWRQDLENLAEQSDRFRMINVLSNSDGQWQGPKGRVSTDLLRDYLSPKSDSNFICVCGPNGFVENGLLALRELDYGDGNVHVFQG